jgi:hypothetical protein
MFSRHCFITNSSSSSFLVWSRTENITPEMVMSWGLPEKIEKHHATLKSEYDTKIDLTPNNIASKINGFKLEFSSEWVKKKLAEMYGTPDSKDLIKELKFMESLQNQGFKTFVYYCEDLLGLERETPRSGNIDRSEVGICIHLILHHDAYTNHKQHPAVFTDTAEGGMRGMVFYLWMN